MHSGANCKNDQIISKIYGRTGWIMVKYVSESSQGFTHGGWTVLPRTRKGECHMMNWDAFTGVVALCQLVVMVIALFLGK